MPDEPTLGELKRTMESGFASVKEVFRAEQRRVDERHAGIQADVAEEKAERITTIKDERAERIAAMAEEKAERKTGDAEQQKQLDKLSSNIKWAFVSVILPVAFFAVTIYLQLTRK